MAIRLNKDNINPNDVELAISVKNYLKAGHMVIGNPGLGLKKTLHELEEKRDSIAYSPTDWKMSNSELEAQIGAVKAGIEGEENLCEYLARLLKYDDDLEGLVAFASLSYEDNNTAIDDLGYIPDTDTLLVYGKNVLVVDAKNIKTKPNRELRLECGVIVDDKDKPVLEVHPSTHIWIDAFEKAGIEIDSIDGYVCIVNNTETPIFRNDEWYSSHTKLIHISELKDTLHKWVDGKDSTLYLNVLTEIAKAQIREEIETELDIGSIKKKFGV